MTPAEIGARVRERLASQRKQVQALLTLRRQLQGSLFVRYGQCGKESCACRTGRGHGPYYVLSARSGGRGTFSYLPASAAREARGQVARYRRFRKGLSALQRTNVALVALLRRYQSAQLAEGQRRMGLPAKSSAAVRR